MIYRFMNWFTCGLYEALDPSARPFRECFPDCYDAFRRGDFTSAAESGDRALAGRPDDLRLNYFVAGLHWKAGNYHAGIRIWRNCMFLDPDGHWGQESHAAMSCVVHELLVEGRGGETLDPNELPEVLLNETSRARARARPLTAWRCTGCGATRLVWQESRITACPRCPATTFRRVIVLWIPCTVCGVPNVPGRMACWSCEAALYGPPYTPYA